MLSFLFLAVVLVAVGLLVLPTLIHRAYRAPRIQERGSPADNGLPFREVRIPTVNGKNLFAWLVMPAYRDGKIPAVAILHGWGGNAEQMLPLAAPLHAEGYAVLLLDARSHGRSDADGFSSLPRFADDLEDGLYWLAGQPGIDRGRLVVLGHSVGAGAALLVAARRHDLAAVVSIAAFAHPEALMRRQLRHNHVPYLPFGWLVLRFVERTIGATLEEIAPCHTIGRVRCPVLLVHGEDDQRVPATDALCIYSNRRDDRTELLMLPGIGHGTTAAIYVHPHTLVAFLRRWLAPAPSGHEWGFVTQWPSCGLPITSPPCAAAVHCRSPIPS